MGFSETELQDLAGLLGSDVPFFFGGPLAFCSGRGEKIKKIEEKFYFCGLLVLPNVSVSTKRVYENYKHDCALYKELKSKTNSLLMKNNIDSLSKMCANMLENSCFGLHSELADLKSRIESLGAGGVCLSGSGGAMYILTAGADENDARRYQAMLESIGCESVIVHNNRW
jgi:4-diphosphocytidyl-2-C-methyl-D-erythritol kinase